MTEYDGRVVLGAYRLEALVGRGSHGLVFRGEAIDSGRQVAVKVPLFLDEQRFARFEREARMLAKVEHENVARFVDFGFLDGRPVIVTEYFAGRRLDEVMVDAGGCIRWQRAVEIMTPVMAALDSLHRAGVIHRDVKPSNILVLSQRDAIDVRLIDLGVCREEDSGDRTGITEDSQVLGTLNYMAPEQLLNLPVDWRCDIYAAGCVLFEMLCGRLPFLGRGIQQAMAKCASDGPPSLLFAAPATAPDVPETLSRLVLSMLRRVPDERPASAELCRQHLSEVLQFELAPAE
ncbi:MAG: serine/threonine-protein kinase [Polyangiales bacterium]